MRGRQLGADKFTLCIQLILIIGVPWVLVGFVSRHIRPVDNLQDRIQELESVNPRYLFIGNSVLESRIDTTLFAQLTGKKALNLQRPGIGILHWYLMLKNIVLPSSNRPKRIFIFFRDGELTEIPDVFETHARRELASLLVRSAFEELALEGPSWLSFKIAFTQCIESPLAALREWAKGELTLASYAIANTPKKERGIAVNQLFDGKMFRTASLMEPPLLFPKDSFLNRLIALSKANDLPVVFVRVSRYPSVAPRAEANAYFNGLRELMASQSMRYFDFGIDSKVTSQMYVGPGDDHLRIDYRSYYTRLFHQRLAEELE